MSKKSIIDSVRVGEPCSEQWEKMRGNDRVRFCSHCTRDVTNLSAITRKEASRLVLASGGNICIRYVKNPLTEEPIYAGQLLQITRRSPALAAGLVSASLALSSAAFAQSEARVPEPPAAVAASQPTGGEYEEPAVADPESEPVPGAIEGFILDTSGAPVPGVSLMIVTADGDNDYATTDELGHYQFDDLEAGTWVIRIASTAGRMKKALRGIELLQGQKLFQNIYVKVAPVVEGESGSGVGSGAGWGSGGAMAMVQYGLALNQAVATDDMDEVRRLLAAGEDVNGRDKNYGGITPLFLAVENGNLKMVKLLLGHGARADAADDTKRTPLMSMDGDATVELVETLIGAGAGVNARDQDGNSVLLHTIGGIDADVLDRLIKAGADLNQADAQGETALMKAAEENDLDLVKALVLAGAKVNEKDNAGESAWEKTSNTEIEAFLEDNGAAADYGTIEVLAGSDDPEDEIGPAVDADEETAPIDAPPESVVMKRIDK